MRVEEYDFGAQASEVDRRGKPADEALPNVKLHMLNTGAGLSPDVFVMSQILHTPKPRPLKLIVSVHREDSSMDPEISLAVSNQTCIILHKHPTVGARREHIDGCRGGFKYYCSRDSFMNISSLVLTCFDFRRRVQVCFRSSSSFDLGHS